MLKLVTAILKFVFNKI